MALVACVLCIGLVLGGAPHALSADADPAARGLDVFVHVPNNAPPGGVIPVQVQAIGFPTVTTSRPLARATVEAAWDPTSLGPGTTTAPPAVRATADSLGRVHLNVPVPIGQDGRIRLLVSVTSGSHQRTRSFELARARSHEVSLYVADERVVPGSKVSAWVLVRQTATNGPAASVPIDLSLLEGGVVRNTTRLRTDAAGTATGQVWIPRIDAPAWSWTLRARVGRSRGDSAGSTSIRLHPREETPGLPEMRASWGVPTVAPGAKAPFVIRVRDASDRPVANHVVRYWIGVAGTTAPSDHKKWRSGRTDLAGEVRGEANAPSPVAPVVGTNLRLETYAKVEGQELTSAHTTHVGASAPSAELLPEGGVMIAGFEQRALLRVRDGWQRPVKGQFQVEGDGLSARVTTDSNGEAEVLWKAPAEVGAYRDVGPCAAGVASSVTIRPLEELPALERRRDPFSLCVRVLRDVQGFVRVTPRVATAGENVQVRVDGGEGKPWSIALLGDDGLVASSVWVDDGAKGIDLRIPPEASGLLSVSAVSPSAGESGRAMHSAVLVKPRVLPSLQASLGAGRAAPGGKVYVDAVLSDGQGHGLQGTVGALVFDLHGGGSAQGLWSLDTRTRLCREVGIDEERCASFLDGDASTDAVRRGLVGEAVLQKNPLDPVLDPGANAELLLRAAFRDVVRSLEGAILEASSSPDRLRDVRRKGPGGGWEFNPELWTLVTAAMNEPPTTPGGEPFSLADLVAVDDQVRFDRVATRVTRLKLMRVLVQVRSFVRERYTDPDEPALSDPAALLRRLVQDGQLSSADLLDPWGGTMQFVRSAGPHLPFLSTRGFRLQAPGPDGRIGTPDDVRDPFERVLRSKSPYAEAVGEDRLVDARLDMQVSDETVQGWTSLIETLTGTSLGLLGVGAGGGGRGEGIGLGTIGTIGHGGRAGFGITTENVTWLPPKRTDANGRVRLEVPLGEIETTWRVALVAVPDASQTAVAQVDVPAALDVSARVDTGARWIAGDQVDARISLRNRTKSAVRASLAIAPGGVAELVRASDAAVAATIPAMGAATVTIPLRAGNAGDAHLEVRTRVPSIREDVVVHHWEVKPKGEPTRVTQTAWLEGSTVVALPFERSRRTPMGTTRLVLERGQGPALDAALDSLDPDTLVTQEAQADALEVALRVYRWAVARGGEADPLARRARAVAERARGRLVVLAEGNELTTNARNVRGRLRSIGGPTDLSMLPAPEDCPPSGAPTLQTALDYLEVEPPPRAGAVDACWDAFVTSATGVIVASRDAVALARAVLALSERSHRSAVALSLVERLRERVQLTPAGWIQLHEASADDRGSRAIVYAALLRSAKAGRRKGVSIERLTAWLLVQRDPYGGYGSTIATRSAVRALLTLSPSSQAPAVVGVIVDGTRREVRLESETFNLDLGPQATTVKLETNASGIVARMERSALRFWSQPPLQPDSQVHLDVVWPTHPRVDKPTRLQVSLRHDLGRPTTIDARIPLPPGVSLAAPVEGVRQIQGVLAIRQSLDDSASPAVLQIPLKFSLAGSFTAPESQAHLAFEEGARAIAPARPVIVR